MASTFRTNELGYTYFDRIDLNGPIFYLLCLGAGKDGKIRDSYADSYSPGKPYDKDGLPNILLYIQRLLLGFFQNILNWLFLKKSDIDFLPNPNLNLTGGSQGRTWDYFKFRVRHFFYALFTLPICIVDTVCNVIFSPIDSLRTLWRFMTQSKQEHVHEKYRLYVKSMLLNRKEHRKELLSRIPLAERTYLCSEKPQYKDQVPFMLHIMSLNPEYEDDKDHALIMLKDLPEETLVYQYKNSSILSRAMLEKCLAEFWDKISIENKIEILKNGPKSTFNNNSLFNPLVYAMYKNKEGNLYDQIPILLQGLTSQQKLEVLTTLTETITDEEQPDIYLSILIRALLVSGREVVNILLDNLEEPEREALYSNDTIIYKTSADVEISANSFLSLLYSEKKPDNQYLEKLLPCSCICFTSNACIHSPLHGYTYALVQQTLTPQHFTTVERHAYLLSNTRPLARAILERPQINFDLMPWLDGLTPQEKITALTPLMPLNANCVNITLENGNNALAATLQQLGLQYTRRFQNTQENNIQYSESIHNDATTKTVCDSLTILKTQIPLSKEQINNAIKSLAAHAETLPKSNDSENVKAVARRALKRLLTDEYLKIVETNSKVTLREILAYYWIGLQQMKPDEIEDKLSTFYFQLESIQRKNLDHYGADITACGGGTINQFTLGLQAIYPQYIWVTFLNNKSLTLHALTRLPEIVKKAYETSDDKQAFALKCKTNLQHVVPVALLNEIASALKEELNNHVIYNRQLDRCAVHKPEELLNQVMEILKGPRNHKDITKEMIKQAIPKLDIFLTEIYCSGKIPTKDFSNSVQKISPQEQQHIKQRYDLEVNNTTKRPRYYLNQYALHIQNPIIITENNEEHYNYIANCFKFAKQNPLPKNLPDSFTDMATDLALMNRLITLLLSKKESSEKIPLLDALRGDNENKGRKWLKSEDFMFTCQLLGIKQDTPPSAQQLEVFLEDNSPKIYQALFRLALDHQNNRIKIPEVSEKTRLLNKI